MFNLKFFSCIIFVLTLITTIFVLSFSLDRVQKQNITNNEKIINLETQVEDLETQLLTKTELLTAKNSAYDMLLANYNSKLLNLSTTQVTLQSVQTQLTAKQLEYDTLLEDYNVKVASLTATENELEIAQAQLIVKQNEIVALQAQVEELQAQVEELQVQVEELQVQVEELQVQVEELEFRIAELESQQNEELALIPTEGLVYSINEDGISATCTGIVTAIDTDIVIASEYEGVPVTSIGDNAFKSGTIQTVTIPDSVTSIGMRAFYECKFLTRVTIPDSVTSIGTFAFYGCSIRELTIGNSVTVMGDRAFFKCLNLTELTIRNGVTSIGNSAFQGCSRLTEIIIPNSVINIGISAFNSCTGLTSVTMENSTPPTLNDTYAIPATTTIYIPRGSLIAYQTATNWSNFADKFVEMS